ncbi:hypothetical protein ABZ896_15785 [Streptomyces sp. NPDC047072]|uniref:hypothetical protein n=1 Tax=Streptomyces sp. NPDC047072 TaxID=3154809 RepID=UPI0033C9E589
MALPSVVFLALPALVVGVWLLAFLALEWLVYPLAGRKAEGIANKPTLSGAPDEKAEERAGGLPGERTAHKPVSRAPVGR